MTKKYVEQRDDKCDVSGTRVSLASLIQAFNRRESPETICQNKQCFRQNAESPSNPGLI